MSFFAGGRRRRRSHTVYWLQERCSLLEMLRHMHHFFILLFLSACVAVRFPPTTTNRCCILSCTISGNKLVFLSSFNMFPSTSCMYNPVYAQQTTSIDNGFPQWISKELHRYQIVINVEVSRFQWQRKSCRQDLDVQAFYYRPF